MICASISSGSIPEMISTALASLARGAEGVEFRIDSLTTPTFDDLILLSSIQAKTIATFKGKSLELLAGEGMRRIAGLFDFVDLERTDSGWPDLPQELKDRLILSFHGELHSREEAVDLMLSGMSAASVVKCINTGGGYARSVLPCKAADGLPQGQRQAIAFSTGEKGTLSRIASLRKGSPVSYARPATGDGTAAGQLTVGEMLSARNGAVLGIVGSKEATDHSLSPLIHSTLLEESGTTGLYLRYPVDREELRDFFDAARYAEIDGFNVTMPFKEEALQLVDGSDATASAAGAVNTVVCREGRFTGYDTDVTAFSEVLSGLRHESALIFGSGGAARAAAYALRNTSTSIAARNAQSRKSLAAEFGLQEFDGKRGSFDLLVNCTPLGMASADEKLPDYLLECEFGAIVDFVYSGHRTPFMQLAASQSSMFVGGHELLARQAVHSFRLWTGHKVMADRVMGLLGGSASNA